MKVIALTKGAFTKVSDEDYERLNKHLWCLHNNGRVSRGVGKKTIYMHHEILPRPADKSLEVDHIDNDPLNNTRSNLRLVTHRENMMNSKSVKRARIKREADIIELISIVDKLPLDNRPEM